MKQREAIGVWEKQEYCGYIRNSFCQILLKMAGTEEVRVSMQGSKPEQPELSLP